MSKHLFYLMISLLTITFPLMASAETYQGLWIGQVELNKVNDTTSTTSTEVLQPVKHVFDMTVLLHVHENGAVSLLKEVTMMQKSIQQDGEDMVQRVLITDDSLLPEYNGIIRRDGKLVGIRLGSLAYDFPIDQTQVSLSGAFGAGNSLETTIVMDEDHPTNPFKHLYHPDHQQGRKITRQIHFSFDSNQDNSNPDDAKFSLIGVYSESISGLHKIPLKISGPFKIHRISEVGKLNE
ncbi:conserved hypothetical protein, secreted [Candidatus Magnetomorum sp. HK-1]|nr:conserved hypothetical protein, secreted [Candidatus Magnetomorum sp. HK-1]